MTGANSCILSQNSDIFRNHFLTFLRKSSGNSRFENRRIQTEIPCEDPEQVGILILILDERIDDDIVTSEIWKMYFYFLDPFLVRDEESSLPEALEIRGNIFLIERDEDIDCLGNIGGFAADMDIIIIQSSLDNRLIF